MLTKNLWNDFQTFMNFSVVFLKIVVIDQTSDDHWTTFISHIFKHTQNLIYLAFIHLSILCLLYTSPSPRDQRGSRMPSSA